MKVIALKEFKLQTPKGILEFQKGQILNLPHEKALDLVNKGIVKPLEDAMRESYLNLNQWLKSFELTSEEIEKKRPEILKGIYKGIEDMDYFYSQEDFKNFLMSVEEVKRLYLIALKDCLKEAKAECA
jgi:hypothetical protein